MLKKYSNHLLLGTIFLVTCSFIFSSKVAAQTGSLDSSFGTHGLLLIKKDPALVGDIKRVLPAPAGDYFVVYQTTDSGGFYEVVIAKYSKDGILDVSYGFNGFSLPTGMFFVDAAIWPNGKIALVGSTASTYHFSIYPETIAAVYNVDGLPDTTFNNNGMALFGSSGPWYQYPQQVTLKGDQMVIGNSVYSMLQQIGTFEILIVNPDGSVSSSFSGGNIRYDNITDPYDYAQAISSNGDKVIVAGFEYNDVSFSTDFTVLQYNADGSPDNAFNGTGKLTIDFGSDDYGYAVAYQNDKIVVAGSTFNFATNFFDFAVARYNKDGSPDNGFNGTGKQIISFASDAQPKSIVFKDGKIIIGGIAYDSLKGNYKFAIVQLDSAGIPDTAFGIDGKQTTVIPGGSASLDELFLNGNRLYAVGVGILTGSTEAFGAVAAYKLDNAVTFSCPGNKMVFTSAGKCDAVVSNIDPVVTSGNNAMIKYQLTGATIGDGTGTVSGKLFNKGLTVITYTLANDTSQSCSFTVSVEDHEAPIIKNSAASPNTLSPADHKLKNVEIKYNLSDNCGAAAVLSIASNEPQSGTGNGDIANDWEILDAHHIKLRAENSPAGNGRTYTITIMAADSSGNISSQQVLVKVPVTVAAYTLKATVSPNPTTTYFTINTQSNNPANLSIKVTDMFGRVIEVKNNVRPNTPVQLGANYRVGLYFAEISQGNKRVILPLLKLRGYSAL